MIWDAAEEPSYPRNGKKGRKISPFWPEERGTPLAELNFSARRDSHALIARNFPGRKGG